MLRIGDLPFVRAADFKKEETFLQAVAGMITRELDRSPPGQVTQGTPMVTEEFTTKGPFADMPCAEPEGDQPYLFVSFAPQDREEVQPVLAHTCGSGLQIWYDDGGADPETRARALEGASYMMVFVSPNSVRSPQMVDEMHTALDQHKGFIVIHLAEAWLPPGLALRLGDLQALLKYKLDPEVFMSELDENLVRFQKEIRESTRSRLLESFSDRGRRSRGALVAIPPPKGWRVQQRGSALEIRPKVSIMPGFGELLLLLAAAFFIYTSKYAIQGFALGALAVLVYFLRFWLANALVITAGEIRRVRGGRFPIVVLPIKNVSDFEIHAVEKEAEESTYYIYQVRVVLKDNSRKVLLGGLGNLEEAEFVVNRLVQYYSLLDVSLE